jgi:hypothetical protein
MLRQLAIVAVPVVTITGCMQVGLLVATATRHTSHVDDAVVVANHSLTVKVVRYREYGPFSGSSSYAVQCRSAQTTKAPFIHGQQDRGWLTLASFLDSTSSTSAIAVKLSNEFQIYNQSVLIWMRGETSPPRISVDGCVTFREWSPASVEHVLIVPAEAWPRDREPAPLEAKPFFCADVRRDCRIYEFGGTRQVRYRELSVSSEGHVSFIASSKAFTVGDLRVESDDWGHTWRYFAESSRQ